MSGKTDGELLAMLGSPANWSAETLDAAKIELWKRHDPARDAATVSSPPELSSLAVYSLILFLLPYFGLPMAISALRRIGRSEGRIYGRKLAWASIIINTVSLLFWLGVIVLTAILAMLGQ
jgi:hypothetical protein